MVSAEAAASHTATPATANLHEAAEPVAATPTFAASWPPTMPAAAGAPRRVLRRGVDSLDVAARDDTGSQAPAPAEASEVSELRQQLRAARRELIAVDARYRSLRRDPVIQAADAEANGEADEADEWFDAAQDQDKYAKQLVRQLEEARRQRKANLRRLREEIDGSGPWPHKRMEVEDAEADRRDADERCMTLQAMRDYVMGTLNVDVKELHVLLFGDDAKETFGDSLAEQAKCLEEAVQAALKEMEERHEREVQELLRASNSALATTNAHLNVVASRTLPSATARRNAR